MTVLKGPSAFGITHGAERWKTVTCRARGAIPGTNWIALAPVPTTATRSPPGECSWSQWAEWNILPAKRSSPGRSGIAGRLQLAAGGHEDLGAQLLAAGEAHAPVAVLGVEDRTRDLLAQVQMARHVVVRRDLLEVATDLIAALCACPSRLYNPLLARM